MIRQVATQKVVRSVVRWALLAVLVVMAPLASAQTPAPGGGPSEGITVHGHWEIEVRNPDGTLALRREFENALTGGAQLLGMSLSRNALWGRWGMSVANGCGVQGADPCWLVEPGTTTSQRYVQTLAVAWLGSPSQAVQLSGSYVATAASTVGQVSTFASWCQPNPVTCEPNWTVGTGVFGGEAPWIEAPGSGTGSFSGTSITPIPVTAGQIVQVRVTISFS